ncbi:MAG: 30S ribosomal protein S5 [Candidatus Gracilibacteria bacterium]|nr:30S ribosomal protein S5 [Candidatus Gracilibacteria bacterium]
MTDETTAPEKTTDEASKESEAKTSEKETDASPKDAATGSAQTEQGSEERGGRRERRPRRGGGRDRRGSKEPKEFEEAILQIDRVTRVVKGGRRLRFRITVVIGDKKGRVGLGIGKSTEVMGGIQKAVSIAKKNLFNVPIMDGTIPHPANAEFKASRVLLFPAPEGKGVIAGGAVRKILELAGLRDVLSKSHGSRNRLNVALATFQALQSMATERNPRIKRKENPEETQKQEDSAEEVKKKNAPKPKAAVKKSATKKSAPHKESSAKKTDSKSTDKQ